LGSLDLGGSEDVAFDARFAKFVPKAESHTGGFIGANDPNRALAFHVPDHGSSTVRGVWPGPKFRCPLPQGCLGYDSLVMDVHAGEKYPCLHSQSSLRVDGTNKYVGFPCVLFYPTILSRATGFFCTWSLGGEKHRGGAPSAFAAWNIAAPFELELGF
jgi:hypothetical protein